MRALILKKRYPNNIELWIEKTTNNLYLTTIYNYQLSKYSAVLILLKLHPLPQIFRTHQAVWGMKQIPWIISKFDKYSDIENIVSEDPYIYCW